MTFTRRSHMDKHTHIQTKKRWNKITQMNKHNEANGGGG